LREDFAIIELADGDAGRFSDRKTSRHVLDFFNDINIKKVYVDVRPRPSAES
jgi:hypothetical protein